jgi:magnesium chelatase family protein
VRATRSAGSECRRTGAESHQHRGKISGPLLDRIDIHIEVPAVACKEMRAIEKKCAPSRTGIPLEAGTRR